MTRAAVLQMVSGPDVAANLAVAERLIGEAAEQGAQLAVLPENFGFLGRHESDKLAIAEVAGQGAMQSFLSAQAQVHALWLVGGSIPLRTAVQDKVAAACLLYAPDGKCQARYDKIHLFDVAVPDSDEQYRESASHTAGEDVVLAHTDAGRLGLSICYDLRFPELYRELAEQGAELLAVPSAFTRRTGEAHWDVLLRARAVENLCYVLAADQGGEHPGGRQTYGGSMIVDPWGRVLARLDLGEGIAVADIDLGQLHKTREHFPALSHRRIRTITE